MRNIFHDIALVPEAVAAWQALAKGVMRGLNSTGPIVTPEEVGGEQAFEQLDGSLVMTGQIRGNEIRLEVAKGDWYPWPREPTNER